MNQILHEHCLNVRTKVQPLFWISGRWRPGGGLVSTQGGVNDIRIVKYNIKAFQRRVGHRGMDPQRFFIAVALQYRESFAQTQSFPVQENIFLCGEGRKIAKSSRTGKYFSSAGKTVKPQSPRVRWKCRKISKRKIFPSTAKHFPSTRKNYKNIPLIILQ